MDLNEAAVFVKVVQAGGFSAAARLLQLPTSTVSARVARLERRLGVTLLQRTTRRLSLTEAGAIYFEHAAEGLGHMLEAEAAISASRGAVQGVLRVTAPADLGDAVLAGIVSRVRQRHPELSVDLLLEDRYVDLVAEGVDVAIRAGRLDDSSLVAKAVGTPCWACLASPRYLESAPPLTTPLQLPQHRCLQFTPLGKQQWTLFNAQGSLTVPLAAAVLINDVGVLRALALSGEGLALLPTYLCRADIAQGLLVRLLPEWSAKAVPWSLVYPKQRFVPPKLRAFIDIAEQELRRWIEG